MAEHAIIVIPGDGIGNGVMPEEMRVIEVAIQEISCHIEICIAVR